MACGWLPPLRLHLITDRHQRARHLPALAGLAHPVDALDVAIAGLTRAIRARKVVGLALAGELGGQRLEGAVGASGEAADPQLRILLARHSHALGGVV
eukprot:CAMPEP_0119388704 /NCGR_PEP_ID=MMETSP1334-20130426/106206_1 /TAXON_ID=127549 /ORGANISM="Calcidiscus leptoporus, Strain RCC1130" /LENGTH=97 /DNA_ID=CAMNT_0007410767 /DNA_START=75 /DNA_END=368 /DNA_ORIENTATION=+